MSKAAILESIRLLLQIVFTLQRVSGKSEEEIQVMWRAEKAKFDENDPANL